MIAIGTLLQDRYRIMRPLGQGGMGAVYQAEDQRLKAPVAIKQTLRADASFAHAFAREARLLAALRHPTIPIVSDYFSEGDGHFLVMQFIAAR
jgi:serine/threonine protein kinase